METILKPIFTLLILFLFAGTACAMDFTNEIQENETVVIEWGDMLYVPEGEILNCYGTLINHGDIEIDGIFIIRENMVINYGTILLDGELQNYRNLSNEGGNIQSSGVLNNYDILSNNGYISNSGTIWNFATINNGGTIDTTVGQIAPMGIIMDYDGVIAIRSDDSVSGLDETYRTRAGSSIMLVNMTEDTQPEPYVEENISDTAAIMEIVPEEVIIEEPTYEEIVPITIAPVQKVHKEAMSVEEVPEEIVPEEIVPEEIVPEKTIGEEIIPEETIMEETVPEENITEEIILDEVPVTEIQPNETVIEDVLPDVILEESTEPIPKEVPEFPTIALPILAIIGLALVMRKR